MTTRQDGQCSFTLVTVEGKDHPDSEIIMAKVFKAGDNGAVEKVETNRPYYVQLSSVPISNIFELSNKLLGLQNIHSHYIFRGEILQGVEPTDWVRAIKRKKGRDEPTLRDADRRWVMLDMDNIPRPNHIDPARDPEAAVDYILTLLPAPFLDCTFHWQFSGSQNVPEYISGPLPDLLKVHLWFWFDRPVSDTELKSLLKPSSPDSTQLFDLQMYHGNQPYFTANPIFKDGLKDPLPVRSGLRIGKSNEVSLPKYTPPKPQRKKSKPKNTGYRATKSLYHDRRLDSALNHVQADDYDTWLKVGMALHGSGYQNTRSIWDDWSRSSNRYNAEGQDKTWHSFTAGGGIYY